MSEDYKMNAVRLVNDFSFAMLEEYIRHLPEKGESWRKMELVDLKNQMSECAADFDCLPWDGTENPQEARDELIDIANLAMLLWHRLGEEGK